jgi:hypothetical protein
MGPHRTSPGTGRISVVPGAQQRPRP